MQGGIASMSSSSQLRGFGRKKSQHTKMKLTHKTDPRHYANLQTEERYLNPTTMLNTSRVMNLSSSLSDKSCPIEIGSFNNYIFEDQINNSNSNNYSRTKTLEFLYFQYLFNTFLECLFSFTSVCSSILQYEIEYNNIEGTDGIQSFTLWISFISSLLLWIVIIFEYYIRCKTLTLTSQLTEKIWQRESSNLTYFILTLLIFFMHPNPVFKGINVSIYNDKYEINCEHSLNSILCIFSLLRMYYFIKFYLVYSDYHSPRTQRVCKMNNFNTNLTFSMKANMIKTPYQVYMLIFIVVLIYCSFCLRIFERVLDNVSGRIFSSYWNSIWCLIITMTTVGYGDYFPSSTLGRMIGIVACICGVFLISMLIVTITNILNFEGTEKNVFLILQRVKLMKERDELAAKLISKYIKMMKTYKGRKGDPKIAASREKLKEEILLSLHYFKEKNKEIDATFPAYSDFDIIIDNLDHLDQTLENLKKKYELIEEHIDQITKKFK